MDVRRFVRDRRGGSALSLLELPSSARMRSGDDERAGGRWLPLLILSVVAHRWLRYLSETRVDKFEEAFRLCL